MASTLKKITTVTDEPETGADAFDAPLKQKRRACTEAGRELLKKRKEEKAVARRVKVSTR